MASLPLGGGREEGVGVFQCTACHSFFVEYVPATLHLALKHPTLCKNALASSAPKKRSAKGGGGRSDKVSLLEKVEFIHPSIKLDRRDLTIEFNKDSSSKNTDVGNSVKIGPKNTPKTKTAKPLKPRTKAITKKSKAKPKSKANSSGNISTNSNIKVEKNPVPSVVPLPDGRVEIKLDTMKASEIEALMNDLFNTPKVGQKAQALNLIIGASPGPSTSSTSKNPNIQNNDNVDDNISRNGDSNEDDDPNFDFPQEPLDHSCTDSGSDVQSSDASAENEETVTLTRATRSVRHKKQRVSSGMYEEIPVSDDEEVEVLKTKKAKVVKKDKNLDDGGGGEKSLGRKRRKRKRECSDDEDDEDFIPPGGNLSGSPSEAENEEDDDEDEIEDLDDADGDEDFELDQDTGTKRKGTRRTYFKDRFHCNICPTKFNLKQKLEYDNHMKENHLTVGEDGNETYICPTCNLGFFPLKLYRIHQTKHRKNPLTCDRCPDKIFRYPYDLNKHKVRHEREDKNMNATYKPFKCPVCGLPVSHRDALKRHMTRHLTYSPFTCKFSGCEKKFNSEYNLRRHIMLHTEGREIYKCESCPESYTRAQRLQDHVVRVHSDNAKPTTKVPRKKCYRVKTVTYDKNLPHPILGVTGQITSPKGQEGQHKDTDVDVNDSRFELESVHYNVFKDASTGDIKIKEEDHNVRVGQRNPKTERPSSRCSNDSMDLDEEEEECANTVDADEQAELEKLRREEREKFMNDPVVQKLMQEDPELVNSMFLPSVQNKTLNHKAFKCKKCPWVGSRQHFLQYHMEKWHKEKIPAIPVGVDEDPSEIKLMCGQCGYSAKDTAELTQHQTTEHIEEKNFPCSACGIRFHTSKRLQNHVQTVHKSEKKFKCEKCPKKFALIIHLQSHVRLKHGTLEFKCDLCGKILATNTSLNNHKLLHKGVRGVFTCKLCNQTSTTKHTLRRHIRYVHLGVENPYNKRKQALRLQKLVQNSNNGQDVNLPGSTTGTSSSATTTAAGAQDPNSSASPTKPQTENECPLILGL